MNTATYDLLQKAVEILPDLSKLSYKQAWKFLGSMLKGENKIFYSTLMMNLDQTSKDKAKLMINVEALAKEASMQQVFDFPLIEGKTECHLPEDRLLFINGAKSM